LTDTARVTACEALRVKPARCRLAYLNVIAAYEAKARFVPGLSLTAGLRTLCAKFISA